MCANWRFENRVCGCLFPHLWNIYEANDEPGLSKGHLTPAPASGKISYQPAFDQKMAMLPQQPLMELNPPVSLWEEMIYGFFIGFILLSSIILVTVFISWAESIAVRQMSWLICPACSGHTSVATFPCTCRAPFHSGFAQAFFHHFIVHCG